MQALPRGLLEAFRVVAFEAGRSIIERVRSHQAESFTTLSAFYRGINPTVVFVVLAIKAPAAICFDGEVPLG